MVKTEEKKDSTSLSWKLVNRLYLVKCKKCTHRSAQSVGGKFALNTSEVSLSTLTEQSLPILADERSGFG